MSLRKILVPVKRVIDYAVKIRVKPDNTAVDTTNVKMSMNPFCEIAVEEALRMREQNLIDQVIAVTIGDKKASDTVRVALSMGADRAIHVITSQQYSQPQPLTIASVLESIVHKEQPSMVILGKQSIDGDNNQTGQMLAGMLGWPQGTFASSIEFDDSKKNIHVTREVDGGLETVSLSLPAIVTCDLRLNEPRFVTLPNVMKAKKKKIETLNIDDLNVDTQPRLEILSVTEPPKRAAGIMVENVDDLVSKLRSEAKVL